MFEYLEGRLYFEVPVQFSRSGAGMCRVCRMLNQEYYIDTSILLYVPERSHMASETEAGLCL
jgi:hypothetical protein